MRWQASTPFDQPLSRAAVWVSFALPLVLGVLCASPEPYWLDSPELTAAVQTLGIPHPPGHPLYVMLVKPIALLPLGGVALRAAIASALFAALACVLLQRIGELLIEATAPSLPRALGSLIALAAALTAFAAYGFWFQAVRAEVYSLQALLALAFLYPLLRFCAGPDRGDDRMLWAAALAFGLGLSNHHFIALCALPAAIPPLVALAGRLGGRGALRAAGRMTAVAVGGLAPYAFLPLRSAVGAPLSLGGVHSPSSFFWVVSARAYQQSMVREHSLDLGQRSVNAVFAVMDQLGPVIAVVALGGFYLLLRRRSTRVAGIVLALLVGVALLLRSVMGFDPFNPDFHGYLMPALATVAVAAAVFAAVAVAVLRRAFASGRWIALLLSLALFAVPALRARSSYARVDLSSFRATRLLVDLSFQPAEPGSLMLASYYKLFFVLWAARYVDGSRPDLTVVDPELFGYPGYLRATLGRNPDLRSLAWSMVVHGRLTEPALAELALERPLRVEPAPWLDERVTRFMLPDGLLYETSPEPLGRRDVIAVAPEHRRRWKLFYERLGPQWKERETWRMLTWCHYLDALFFARRGHRDGARRAVEMARRLGSAATQIVELERALEDVTASGPLDVTPFLPEALRGEAEEKEKGDSR